MINKLLAKQVQSQLGNTATPPEAFTAFIKSVSRSYDGFDDKIKSLESLIDEHTNELIGLNEKLLNETTELKNSHNELSRIFNHVNEGFFIKDIIYENSVGFVPPRVHQWYFNPNDKFGYMALSSIR
jgi:archaellum component FlaC